MRIRLTIALLFVQSATTWAQSAVSTTLQAEISQLSQQARGRVGVGAVHLETGRSFYQAADEKFPMASTYKVPIAFQLMKSIEEGEVHLSEMITLDGEDLHPGSGTLSSLFDDPGVSISLHNLLELMLLISDNSATDLVLAAAGGSAAVTSQMKRQGIEGIRVDRPTIRLIGDWIGIQNLPADRGITRERFNQLAQSVSSAKREAAARAFDRDPRDTATPRAMVTLLQKIWKADGISRTSADLLIDTMGRCQTGENRIKGLLPQGTEVAHKTGTIGRTTNDVGVISLPHGRGHLAVVVFVRESERPVEIREKVIAQISRSLYDFFLYSE